MANNSKGKRATSADTQVKVETSKATTTQPVLPVPHRTSA